MRLVRIPEPIRPARPDPDSVCPTLTLRDGTLVTEYIDDDGTKYEHYVRPTGAVQWKQKLFDDEH